MEERTFDTSTIKDIMTDWDKIYDDIPDSMFPIGNTKEMQREKYLQFVTAIKTPKPNINKKKAQNNKPKRKKKK